MIHVSPHELAAALCGRLVKPIDGGPTSTWPGTVAVGAQKQPSVVIDSRKVEPGSIFWALPGEQRDGADFIADAFARGAIGAVTSRRGLVPPPGCWLIEVADPLAALHRLAALYRERTAATVIAVTGSVGKTTAKELIRTLLSQRHATVASAGNHNNHLGVPLSMLGLEPGTQFGVFELAASGPGEIADLAALCRPHWGVITSVADAHLQGFGDSQGVTAAKAELAAALPGDGLLIANGDDERLRRWAAARKADAPRICWVGRGANCDIRADHVRYREGQLEFRIAGIPFCVALAGRHFLPSVLAAIAVAVQAGWDLGDVADALVHFTGVPMRCEVSRVEGVTIINDAYNACPTSMLAAFRALWETPPAGRRFVICGDMLELGPQSPRFHAELGEAVVHTAGADGLLACGHFAQTVASAARWAGLSPQRVWASGDVQEALPQLAALLQPGDTVLVKASRAVGLEAAAENLKKLLAQRPNRHFPATESLLFTLPVGGMKDLTPADRI